MGKFDQVCAFVDIDQRIFHDFFEFTCCISCNSLLQRIALIEGIYKLVFDDFIQACHAMHHGAGVFVFDAGCLAVRQGEAAASLVVAEGDEGAFHLVVIGVAGDAHLHREHTDTDEVLGWAEGLVRRVLFLSELVGGP